MVSRAEVAHFDMTAITLLEGLQDSAAKDCFTLKSQPATLAPIITDSDNGYISFLEKESETLDLELWTCRYRYYGTPQERLWLGFWSPDRKLIKGIRDNLAYPFRTISWIRAQASPHFIQPRTYH